MHTQRVYVRSSGTVLPSFLLLLDAIVPFFSALKRVAVAALVIVIGPRRL